MHIDTNRTKQSHEVKKAAPAPRKPRDSVAEGLGEQVSACRKRRQLKVSELARLVGVSPSLISQIERGYSQPSVSTLFALSQALDVPVDTFFVREGKAVDAPPTVSAETGEHWLSPDFEDATEAHGQGGQYRVVRANSRDTINIEGGVRWERLLPNAVPDVDFLEMVCAPGVQSTKDLYRHPGSEMVLVLSGELEITVGFDTYKLSVGDSLHFLSSTPHRYVNPSDEVEARAVTVVLRD